MRSLVALLVVGLFSVAVQTQSGIAPVNDLPNPYQPGVRNWAAHGDGRAWGSTAGIDIGPTGEMWAIDRCGVNSCEGSNRRPSIKSIRRAARSTRSIGAGLFAFPHGLHVDGTATSG